MIRGLCLRLFDLASRVVNYLYANALLTVVIIVVIKLINTTILYIYVRYFFLCKASFIFELREDGQFLS
jgi:hypothetical protein